MRLSLALIGLCLFAAFGFANGRVQEVDSSIPEPNVAGIRVRTTTPTADHIYWLSNRNATLDRKPVSLKNLKTRMGAGDTLYAIVAPDLSGVEFFTKEPVEMRIPEMTAPVAPYHQFQQFYPNQTCPNCRR